MKDDRYHEAVAQGIQYLDETYSGWWHKVDLTTLDMTNTTKAILSQVSGIYMYDTREVNTWPVHTLRLHGFLCPINRTDAVRLTAEWSYRIRQIKDARRWESGNPPSQEMEGK